MSNLSSSSASGKNVNFQGCSHSNDGSVSTWDADCSDIKSEETVKSSFKILLRSSLFTVLLLAVHWSNSNGPYSQWKGEATNEVKVQRNRRMLYNNTGRYVSSDYNASMENLAGSRENNEQTFRNMENDFRYPNFMYNSLNQQNNVSNSLYSNLNNNALFYIFSFIAGLFLISQVGAERLFFLASAMGIAYHIRKSVRSS
ncbi:hypothetical protein PCYB_021170 [Plasmodium cynomolgi strain B]|uniref:Uncharacterized protein n=1 Tax=Plasmodium cynomolgi (strain B) TaxID=1120755 RepID=K6UI05_PLACD|nr:hypothetical protein PCYB_021170 [Plasmodium cynomolgi strain B]GAB64548.1 hypothetical protein PCYB_021170 [Plasmodium cynomolgi strain B]